MKYITLIILAFFFLVVNAVAQDFHLSGELHGLKDGYKIIINPILDNMDVDMQDETTILLKNGKFEFSRKLEKPTKFSVRFRPLEQDDIHKFECLFFWAENTSMNLEGEKGKIFKAKITGSKIQDEYFESNLIVDRYKKKARFIGDSLRSNQNLSQKEKAAMRTRIMDCMKGSQDSTLEFFYNNPNYYCSAAELVSYITFSPDKIDKLKLYRFYNELPLTLQKNVYGKQIKIYLEGNKMNLAKLKIGDYPYNFSLKDTSGITTEFSSIGSKLILLDFWASGCGPCRLGNRAYPKIYEEFKDKGFEIVSVSCDQSKERLKKAMNEDKINWISLWDENKEVYRDLYQIRALPTNYLIYNGKIVAKDIAGENLRPKLIELLNNAK